MAESYRMKPLVTVEAMQVLGANVNVDENVKQPPRRDENGSRISPYPGNFEEVANWLGTWLTVGEDRLYEIEVPTHGGFDYARTGDWIVKERDGLFAIIDDATFQAIYVPAGQ